MAIINNHPTKTLLVNNDNKRSIIDHINKYVTDYVENKLNTLKQEVEQVVAL